MENLQEAINMLEQGHVSARQLSAFVQGSECELLLQEITSIFSSAISNIETQNKKAPLAKDKKSKGHSAKKSTGNRRRIDTESCTKLVSETSEDSYIWRKYGQKVINGLKYPRCYYRCTHKDDQNCNATKQVQQSTKDPSKYEIFYFGNHTCTNLYYNQHEDPQMNSSFEKNSSFELNFSNNSNTSSEISNSQSSKLCYSPSISSDPMWQEPFVANCVAAQSVESSTGSVATYIGFDEDFPNFDVSSYMVDQFDLIAP